MNALKKPVLPVLMATAWISIFEFARNEFLLKSYWIKYYRNLGLGTSVLTNKWCPMGIMVAVDCNFHHFQKV